VSSHQLFGCITPISFNFEGELQELLIRLCKLGDKSWKHRMIQLYEERNYVEIMKSPEDVLDFLTFPQLEDVGTNLFEEIGKRQREERKGEYIKRLRTFK
jgi:hypothetical protein